jgi:signal transduction histidine kinase
MSLSENSGLDAARLASRLDDMLSDLGGALSMLRSSNPPVMEPAEYLERTDRLMRGFAALSRGRRLAGHLHALAGDEQEEDEEAGCVDANTLVMELGEAVRGALPLGVHLEVRTTLASAPCWGDEDRLRRALGCILDDAVQSVGSAGTIKLTLRRMAGHVVITVSEDGTASADTQALRPRPEAVGMGLAVAEGLLRRGGGISVARRAGQGSRVALVLPARP